MTASATVEPRLVSALPGRIRVNLPSLSTQNQRQFEVVLRDFPGVESVRANPLTGNVLIQFSPGRTNSAAILNEVEALRYSGDIDRKEAADVLLAEPPSAKARVPAPSAPAFDEKVSSGGAVRRARIAVRGLDRDPRIARQVVERLTQLPGVRHARANPLTGRVLVEWSVEHQLDLEDLVSEVSNIELPSLPGEDRPDHPLDPAPLIQSSVRTIGAGLGLGLLGAQRMAGSTQPLISGPIPAYVGGAIGIIQSFPILRQGLASLLGPNLSQLLLSTPDILLSALSGSPLALVLSGLGAFQVLTEVVSRRAAWRRYEDRLSDAAEAAPGSMIRVESGEKSPLAAVVIEGSGTAVGADGLPTSLSPGSAVPAGAWLSGGPFVLELAMGEPFVPAPRSAPPAPGFYDRYQQIVGIGSPISALALGLLTRSPARAFEGLLLVNPRAAIIGQEVSNTRAAARVLRAGVIVAGTRPERKVRRPDVLLVDGVRVLTSGLEVTSVRSLSEKIDADETLAVVAAVSEAIGAPWGAAFPPVRASDRLGGGGFDGATASATVNGTDYIVRPVLPGSADESVVPASADRRGEMTLLLCCHDDDERLGVVTLRPRLANGAAALAEACRRDKVEILLLSNGDLTAAKLLAERARIALVPLAVSGEEDKDALAHIRSRQASGLRVAFLSDSAAAAEAFAACDLAIGLSSGRSGHFPARADLLAPDLRAVGAIIDAGSRRDRAVRDGVLLSSVANVAGIVWGLRGGAGLERASRGVYIAAIAAIGIAWARLRGGETAGLSVRARLADPRPERWGRRSVESVLSTLQTQETGLTSEVALARRTAAPARAPRNALLSAILDQLRSPLVSMLAVGAGLTMVLGSPLDFSLIAATVIVNVGVGVFQERQTGRATEALARMGSVAARVLRDGRITTVPTSEIAVGDVLVLSPGDRVAADARLIRTDSLEVDEAALTGESLPVRKTHDAAGSDGMLRIVLEGSDVTTGSGRAVVFAVGSQTRLGATASALAMDETEQSPLGIRLALLLRQFLPLALAGGGLVVASGLLRGAALVPQLGIGATIALASVPEGLPLLAGLGEAAVAKRLAKRNALVQRLSAVEALGRVDVACTDKTGTLTEGRLGLVTVESAVGAERVDALAGGEWAGQLSANVQHILLTGALACPHPDSSEASAHATDVAVVAGADRAGLFGMVREAIRGSAAPFDAAARPFHATQTDSRLCVKGAPEAIVARCEIGDAERETLLGQAERLAGEGLRVLLVAEGDVDGATDNPRGLKPLGFLGIRDPLRAGVQLAVKRCHDAGIRVIMLTGDHPATAQAIGVAAGLVHRDAPDGEVLTCSALAELDEQDLDRALATAVVIARATPLDKLRIIESLQRQRHTVSMTGDGVNDAPALRLADVGVAMGKSGTEVARHAADVVLADDDFSTLVEALVEGRGFWRNTRRALGLLLGGNLGELALVVAASVLGLGAPLVVRQILAVNLITDAVPALAVALQKPEHRRLNDLAREGTEALDTSLRRDVIRRTLATSLPTLAAFFYALRTSGLPAARTIAFAGIVSTQLAQTLRLGWTEGSLSKMVAAAVAGSYGLLLVALTVPQVRSALLLTAPTPVGWGLIAAATAASVVVASAPDINFRKYTDSAVNVLALKGQA